MGPPGWHSRAAGRLLCVRGLVNNAFCRVIADDRSPYWKSCPLFRTSPYSYAAKIRVKDSSFNKGAGVLYAHSVDGSPQEKWQTLESHLLSVAGLAQQFAAPFGASDWACLLGLLHDAGKASDAFQERLKGSSVQVDHSTAGAQYLNRHYPQIGRQLAYAVAGHHGGIPNGTSHGSMSSLRERLAKQVDPYDGFLSCIDEARLGELIAGLPSPLESLSSSASTDEAAYTFTFLLRMLYSCLVDADYLDTEAFFAPDLARERAGGGLSLLQIRDVLASRMAALHESSGHSEVNLARMHIHSACIASAEGAPGLYTLTVPTGGGKTLSSLAFALNHAIRHGMDRVIYAIPFTSIVEQTASTFKSLFGPESVLEHHCNYDWSENSDAAEGPDSRIVSERLAMENWDARLIVTTNVQLFESIYSNKPSRCRKNHNLANSVIILDEAQSIPDKVLKPCLAALRELSENYRSTVVLCTATQPALDAVWPFDVKLHDIVPSEIRNEELFEKRSSISYLGERGLEDVARSLCSYKQALCIVSTRRAASALYELLSHGGESRNTFHLSAAMVPAHRTAVIATIKRLLGKGEQCRVISTQIIEAGVDIDFPVVFREAAGIDSIKQAAGRCNREGLLAQGDVFVFDCPETRVTKFWLGRMRQLGLETITQDENPFGPSGVTRFFKARYQVEDTDAFCVMNAFADARKLEQLVLPFDDCGSSFRLVEEDGLPLFVPWGAEGMALLSKLRARQVDIALSRRMQRFMLNVPIWQMHQLEQQSVVARSESAHCWVLEPQMGSLVCYSDERGLITEAQSDALIV